jgi:hypothetical protein
MPIHPCADACRLAELEAEIARLQTRLDAMRQCFIDNTLRTTPSAKGTNIGQQIDEAVDRVVKNMKVTANPIRTPDGVQSGD